MALTLPWTAPAADILYQTSFEAPAFTSGLPIRGQDNWEMFHEGEAISVSTSNARTGDQCLRFDGALLEPQANGSSTAYCFSRALEALATPPPIVEITASVRLDGPPTGTAGTPEQDILSANLMAVVPKPGGEGESLGGFYVSSGGRIWTYSRVPEENYRFSVPYVFGTYRTLTLRVDFIGRQMTWLVDGIELGSGAFLSTITADRLLSGYLFLSGPTDPRSTPDYDYDPANYTAYFDDYSLDSVPISPVNVVIEFGKADFLTDEFRPAAEVRVIRRGFVDAAVRATVITADDTAKAGEDYEATTAFVTFAAGETEQVVEVPLRDDYWPEPDKSFRIRLTGLPPGATSPVSRATVRVRDDERPGSIDWSWSTRLGLPPFNPDEPLYALPTIVLRQPDGKLILQVETANRDFTFPPFRRLLRIHADGSVDPTYPIRDTYPATASSHLTYRKVHALPDGGLLVYDTEFATSLTARVTFRLQPDGSVDGTFPTLTSTADFELIPQADGKLLVSSAPGVGTWVPVRWNGQSMPRYFRLNADGTVDQSFTGPANIGGGLRLFPNGQIYLEAHYAAPYRLYRLNSDGSLDSSFNAASGVNFRVHHVLEDGKILATTQASNVQSEKVYRLNADGTADVEFAVGTAAGTPTSISPLVLQPGGKIIVTGIFSTFNGQVCNSIVRLNADGTIDPTFQSGLGFTGWGGPGQIFKLWELPDGRLLVDGGYEHFDGQRVTAPIVLFPDGSRDASFEGALFDLGTEAGGITSGYFVGVADGMLYASDIQTFVRLRMDLPLRLVSTTRDPGGATRLVSNALTGRNYTLQFSDDLEDWADLATEAATTNRVEFVDQPEMQPGERFYRVRQE